MKLFVDNRRKPELVYSDPTQWEVVTSKNEFRTYINNLLSKNQIPIAISFDYNLESDGDGEGLNCLKEFVNVAIKLRLPLPKIYLHCFDRSLAIDFENTLNQYTRKTNIPYNFEYTKQN